MRKIILITIFFFGLFAVCDVYAQTTQNSVSTPVGLKIQFDTGGGPEDYSQSIKILLLLTALSLAPSAIIMCTSFTLILIVLGMLRQALGTQSEPQGQILSAISLFLTIFIMAPVWTKINDTAIKPYTAKQITQQQAWDLGIQPVREFMLKQTGEKELALFVDMSGRKFATVNDLSLDVLIPAFMVSELKTAFQMGFLIFLPFIVIDMVVSTILMSLGMMMLPPMMISMPIKILFFVLADGWTLLIKGIVTSFSL